MSNKKLSGLSLLQNYDSDSDNDSGYRSEEERKRKHSFINPRESKSKRRRTNSEEDMVVDNDHSPHSSSSFHSTCDSLMDDDSAGISNAKKFCQRKDLTPISHQESSVNTLRSVPFPEEFLVSSSATTISLEEHQGRVRSFPHERGNWASIVYIPLTFGIFRPHFISLVESLITSCKDSKLDFIQCVEFHISLSPTFVLRIDWIEPLVQDFKRKLSVFKKFSCWLYGLDVFCNDEKTRTFLALKVGYGKREMREMSTVVSQLLQKYNLHISYKDYSFHVSVAWCLGDKVDEMRSLVPLLSNICDKYFSVESDMRTFDVPEVHFKSGNRVHRIILGSS